MSTAPFRSTRDAAAHRGSARVGAHRRLDTGRLEEASAHLADPDDPVGASSESGIGRSRLAAGEGLCGSALTRRMPRFTVTAATNSNPVRFTLAEPVPWSGSTPVFIGGATGAWSAVNAPAIGRARSWPRASAPNTFTVPIDSRRFGSFSGQRLVLFFSEGEYSGYGYQGLDWQSMLEGLGIAYQVTGDAAYASKGIELVDYIASLGVAGMLAPVAIDSGFPTRSAIYGLAIAYDWFQTG